MPPRPRAFTSGLTMIAIRAAERARALRARRSNRSAIAREVLPVPPGNLVARVAGEADIGWFLAGGRLAAETIRETLADHGVELERFSAMLDFGCGCGRVVRHWRGLDGPTIWGTDYDAALVDWCRANLPFARFTVNALHPPLPYEAGAFDLVYALSVLTHLPQDAGHAWMAELARVLQPGGYLLVTTQGERYVDQLTDAERRWLLAGEVVTRHERMAGTNRCSTFHPPHYVQHRLAPELDLAAFIPAGARGNPWQDVALFAKPPKP